jgi:hypothetical protein
MPKGRTGALSGHSDPVLPARYGAMRYPRKVHTLPLQALWDEEGSTIGERVRSLGPEDVRALLRLGPVQFVEANVGTPLRWLPLDDCFRHWKAVKPNLVASCPARLDDYPGGFFYRTSEWKTADGVPVVLLEMHH